MIHTRRTTQGAWELSALVRDKETPFTYYDRLQVFDYTKSEAVKVFKEHLAHTGKTIVKD